jgi:hypothetical protein
MGGDDDLVIERIRKNERFRRLEEERRQERLRKACGDTTTFVVGTVAVPTTATTKNDNDEFKEPARIQKTANNHHSGPSMLNIRSTSATNAAVTTSQVELGSTKSYKNSNKGVSFAESNDSVSHPMPKGMGRYVHTSSIMASSPSSSVTMSQPTPPDKSMQHQLSQPMYISNRIKNKPPRKKNSTLLDSSSEEDVNEANLESILRMGPQLDDRKAEMQRRDSSSTRSNTNSTTQSVANSSTAKRKLLAFSSESDDDDAEEILARAQKLDEEKRNQSMSSTTKTTTPDSKDRSDARKKSRPRNPFTLMKEEDDCYENIYKMNTSNAAAGSRNLFQGEALNNNNSLWSDDSAEEDHRRRSHTKMSIVTSKKRKSKDPKSPENDHTATKRRSHGDSKNTSVDEVDRNDNNDDDDEEDEDDSQTRSHPYFHQPKFGPYDPPVPFVLRSSDDHQMDDKDHRDNEHNVQTGDSHHYQVPASMNRYLPDYQRAGIEFMYRCGIVTKGGAILGDGTNYTF